MSQSGVLDIVGSTPEIPTQFDADTGSAIPAANILNIFGGTGINTSGAGNTITIATAASIANTYTANSGSATPASHNLNIYGGYVAAGATGPLETSGSGSTITANIQLSSAQASSSATNAGVSSFSSTYFSVDANGFVTTSGSGISETLTGNTGGAVGPSAGNINTVGTGSITIVGNPGTNTTTTELTGLTAHAVLVGAGTATITKVGPSSTTGQVLQSQGSSADPAFSTATYPATTTINQILFSSAANTVAGITAGNYGVLISSSSGVPSWLANGTTGQVLTATTSGTPSWSNAAASSVTFTGDTGTPFSGAAVTVTGGTTGLTFAAATPDLTLGGTLKLANGGTNANLTASNGGIFYSTASAGAILAGTSTANQVLLSGSSAAPAWSTATYPATTTINQLLYSSAANTIAGVTAGDYGVLISSSSGVPSWLANGTTGQVLTATTSGTPSWENPASSGTVTSVSVVSANGFAGTVATATTTPAITLTTTQTGLLSGNGTAVTGTAITQYNVITGGASNAPNSVSPGSTSGVPLISQGASSQPIFGTAAVAGGGTGNTTFSAYSVICAGTTATGAFQNVSGVGSSGQYLKSNGAGALPSWATPSLGSWVLIQTQNASSSSTISFTSGITSTYSTYMLVMSGVVPSTLAYLSMVFSVNGGTSYLSTGYTSAVRSYSVGSSLTNSQNQTSVIQLTGGDETSTNYGVAGIIYFFNLANSSEPEFYGTLNWKNTTSGGSAISNVSGNNSTTSGVNAIQIAPSAGNFTTGKFSLYGLVQ